MKDLDEAVARNLLAGLKRQQGEFDKHVFMDAALDDAFKERSYLRAEHQYTPRLPQAAWRVAFEAIAAQHVTEVGQEYAALLHQRCQSPVEELLFIALAISTGSNYALTLRAPSAFYHDRKKSCCTPPQTRCVFVCPQHQSGLVHVDFMVTHIDPEPVHRDDGSFETTWKSAHVMVECDGHDFHEKTKEQARRDKKRDRELQKLGFPVLRYTGSEVWADPLACSDEILSFLRKALGYPA